MVIDTKDSKDVNTAAINEVSISKDGTFKFKLYDKLSALEKMGRELGMFKEQKESKNININKNIQYADDMTDEEILEEMKALGFNSTEDVDPDD
jgi:phage terminase small subunit